jgi:hypothetical protein
MDLLGQARKIEAALSGTFAHAAERLRSEGPREPLEIAVAIVDAVAREVRPAGRGTYVFPFNRLKISIAAADKEARARLEAVLGGAPTLRERIGERLHAAGCAAETVDIRLVYVPHASPTWPQKEFHLDLQRVDERPPEPPPVAEAPAALELTVEHGAAEHDTYRFASERVDMGRCAEVRDNRSRLIRANHVAFIDSTTAVNASVSRRHAHIAFDAASGHHRVCDDGSVHGTGVLRAGRTIVVPSGSRGIRLESGDVIVLGEARVRVVVTGRA